MVCSNSVLLLGGAGKEVGEDGTGNVMPHREHGAGDGCQRILCKVGGSQRGGQTGVLHSDLDGNCTALGGIQLQQLTHAKAGEVAQQVVQDDHGKDQQAAGHDLGGVCGHNSADDEHDGGGGDQRQHTDGILGERMEEVVDHKAILSGTSRYLSDLIHDKLNCKSRAIEFSTLQRCASHLASRTDVSEAYAVGGAAAAAAFAGETGKMIALKRVSEYPYQGITEAVDVQQVANLEKKVPLDWITPDGMQVTAAFEEYARPLILDEVTPVYVNGTPRHICL